MKYFVHIYHVVRTKVSIEAEDHVDAMKKADEFIPNIQSTHIPFESETEFQGHGVIHHTENAEEVVSYLVDEVGDTEYERTCSYDADYSPTQSGPKQKMFLIVHEDEMGENFDAVIEAETPSRAQELWCEQWERDLTAGEGPQRVYEINPTGKAGVLGWNTNQLRRLI